MKEIQINEAFTLQFILPGEAVQRFEGAMNLMGRNVESYKISGSSKYFCSMECENVQDAASIKTMVYIISDKS